MVSCELISFLAAALMLFGKVAALADDVRIEVRTQGEVRYLSGGIGIGEREALTEMASRERMNLKLVFAEREGPFLSAVPVTITDASGSVRLQVKTDGPWLFVRIPAAEYRYRAERRGHVQSGSVTVSETGRTDRVVSFP
jgi:hypothetical protein